MSLSAPYQKLLNDVRLLLDRARIQAYKSVDNIRVLAYWQIGERIAREGLQNKSRAAYSKKIVKKLAIDLGFSRVVLYRILQFYKAYPIVSAVPRQLSWTHLVELILEEDADARRFYELLAIKNSWSSRRLGEEIKKKSYFKKTPKLIIKQDQEFPLQLPEMAFKDTYDFEFLNLSENYNESEVEQKLFLNVEKLLLEFGYDFSLVGRQRRIVIDGQTHNVDIEFFHRGIPCIVLVDLKIGKFKSEYIGQMNKYLNYYREKRKYHWEKDPIGLIVCEYKGKEEVHYALGNLQNKIFVAEYKVKLPTEAEIAGELEVKRR